MVAWLGQAAALPLPEYSLGETATVDVATPIKLIVLDPERTESLRQAEARRVPVFYRLDPQAADEVETAFRTHFLLTREKFLAALEESFPRRRNNAQFLTNARWLRLVAAFPGRNRGFPLTTNLARAWALGQSDEPIQNAWAARLREAMSRPIRPDAQPPEARSGPPQVRLLSLPRTEATPTLAEAEKQSRTDFRTNLVTLGRAKSELLAALDTNEQSVGKHLAAFLKAQCVFEADLTHQARAQRTEALFSADHYEPGQVLVRAGQVVDARVKAALDELRARLAAGQAQAEAARAEAEATLGQLRQQTAMAEFKSQHFDRQNRWLLAGLLIVACLSSLAIWRLARSRRPVTRLPVPARLHQAPLVSEPDCLPADRRIATPTTTTVSVSGGPFRLPAEDTDPPRRRWPGMALLLQSWVTRWLVAERSHLLSTQARAERDVSELEQRLRQLQAPLEERLRAYERRIAELEQDLAVKGAENRELIQARIALTRRKLADEKSRASAVSDQAVASNSHFGSL